MILKKISIIVPVYKVEKYLNRCIESIINQTYENLEIILVDDGSPDNCSSICDEYLKKNNRIKVIHKENRGLLSARNAGLDIATGNYIGILAKRGDMDEHKPICSDWPNDLLESTFLGLQENYRFYGNTALFFRTSLLKENLFKEFEGEKFLPLDSLYFELDKYGTMILCKETLYYCEYLNDGITAKYKNY